MKRGLIGLGLAASLLFGCGDTEKSNSEKTVSEVSPKQHECMGEFDESELKKTTDFIVKSCVTLGMTEFEKNEFWGEAVLSMVTIKNTANGRTLECLISDPINDAAGGITTDCNWDAYNDQGK